MDERVKKRQMYRGAAAAAGNAGKDSSSAAPPLNDSWTGTPPLNDRMAGNAPLNDRGIAAAPLEGSMGAVGKEQLREFDRELLRYRNGKAMTERRIVSAEQWWKLHNTEEEQKKTEQGRDGGWTSKSGWMHNVIVSKHADAMDAYPEPIILPREATDREEATRLSAIIPCIMEQTGFEQTYSDAMWQKLKTGTGVYKIIWDAQKLGGLGDVAIERVNLLNLYWEPGITDIQRSKYFFHAELEDKNVLEARYPQLEDALKSTAFQPTKFKYDDAVDTANKATVVEVYYHRGSVLHYVKYVGDVILHATENEPGQYPNGLYDHGQYPYVFDTLFPIEGSPCGYGFVDICRNPQTEIDLLKTSFVKNAMVGAQPRYFSRVDGSVNLTQFLDLSTPLVTVNGNLGEDALRPIGHTPLDGNYVNLLDRTIQELRETSGNTEASTGNVASGVTAASAIAALQEASGKGSRDSSMAAYRAYMRGVNLVIELIRQFYTLPRQFRITGKNGEEQFTSYSNAALQPQSTGMIAGEETLRLPVFDIKVTAQKKSSYTRITQNELALQFFQMGFFNPQLSDQAMMCLEMMDFDGRDEVIQRLRQYKSIQERLIQYMKLALNFAQEYRPELVEGLMADIMQTTGQSAAAPGGAAAELAESDRMLGVKNEPGIVRSAKDRTSETAMPEGGAPVRAGARR